MRVGQDAEPCVGSELRNGLTLELIRKVACRQRRQERLKLPRRPHKSQEQPADREMTQEEVVAWMESAQSTYPIDGGRPTSSSPIASTVATVRRKHDWRRGFESLMRLWDARGIRHLCRAKAFQARLLKDACSRCCALMKLSCPNAAAACARVGVEAGSTLCVNAAGARTKRTAQAAEPTMQGLRPKASAP